MEERSEIPSSKQSATQSVGTRDLFRNRFVATILTSGVFLQIGIWVRNFGVLLYVNEKTHGNATAISLISVAEFLPIVLFSFIGGTFADRWRPKRTMVWSDLLSGLSIAAVLLVLRSGTWQVIFFATLVSSILSQFSQPSGMRLFKIHVPEELTQSGMSLYQTQFAIFMILGPMIGTVVFQNLGIDISIAITGVAFLCSAATLTFLPPDRMPEPVPESADGTSIWEEMKMGVKYVLRRRVLTTLGISFLIAGLGLGLIQPLGIFIITERLHLPAGYLQWLTAVNGVAMIIGGLLSMTLSNRLLPQRLIILGCFVNAVVFVITALSTHLWLTLVVQFLSGLFMPALQIGISTMILQNTEEPFVGRVNGSLNPLFMGGMVITMSAAGVLKELTSLVAMYVSAGVLFLICVAVLLPIYNLKPPAPAAATVDASV